ncbi:MAG: glutathione S-transferase family protein [Stenotrophobium sp.]
MILIGMFDSPFVRRVAVSMRLLDLPFEHRNWSVGKDQTEIRRYNPLGRVPTLVLDDGETLIESSAILDYLDDNVGPARALLPRGGTDRRLALKLMAIAIGAAEKGVAQLYEVVFRPEDKRHAPWVARCRSQMEDALGELDRYAAGLDGNDWLLGERMTQADITVTAVTTFLHEALTLDTTCHPALMQQVARCEALPIFRDIHLPFFAPQPNTPSA